MTIPKNLNLVVGDLFSTKAQVIGHGTNTKGLMGAGIATIFRKKYPEMFELYAKGCRANMYSGGDVMLWHGSNEVYVANIFSQENPGANARLDFLSSALEKTFETMGKFNLNSLAIPLIGCGIGGLEWTDVYAAIVDLMEKHPEIELTVYSLEPMDGFSK